MYDKPIHRRAVASVSPDLSGQAAALPEQLIMPVPKELSSAEPLKIEVIDSLAGLARLPLTDGIAAIHEGPLLTILLEHADLVGARAVALIGVPDVEYTAKWEQAVWGIERASYGDLVTEMVAIDRVDALMAKQGGSRQKPVERRAPEITKNRTRHYDEFAKHTVGEDDAAVSDELGGSDEQ